MKFTVKSLNRFLLYKLPSAYLCGVRVKSLNNREAIATVKHSWINQNPFRSLYWAVQGMTSELATGILVMKEIAESGKKISMLVINQKGSFSKKATGKIRFICEDG
ncbi:MAG: thioesterase, partial [Flavobacteriaceae bacterium]|nr:thioesterase [Flavobacteriaceae bacterium]